MFIFKSLSLKKKFLIMNILAITVPVLLLGIVSFKISTSLVTEKVSLANRNTVVQLGEHIETIIKDVEETSLFLLQDARIVRLSNMSNRDTIEYYMLKRELESVFSQLCTSKSYLEFLLIKFFNGDTLVKRENSTSTNLKKTDMTITDADMELLRKYNGQGIWSYQDVDSDKYKYQITYSRLMKDITDQVSPFSYMRLYVNESALKRVYNQATNIEDSKIYIINGSDIVLSTNDEQYLGKKIPVMAGYRRLATNKSGYFSEDGMLMTYYKFSRNNWMIINTVPLRVLLHDNRAISGATVAGAFIGIIVGLVLTFVISNMIFRRLSKLEQVMKTIDSENFSVRAEVAGSDEIDGLAVNFNKMADRIKEMMDVVYLTEIEKQRSEIAMMQAQINPHFLYNALDTIYWMCRTEGADSAGKLVIALSRLFRMALQTGDGTCTLEEEVNCIGSYIEIQKERYRDKVSIDIIADRSLYKCRVLKMLLQPMIENILEHAFAGGETGGSAGIIIARDQDDLVYTIVDNGAGANQKKVEELMKTGDTAAGFALRNVNKRLTLAYGAGYSLKFISNPGEGTKVIIRQPVILDKSK